MAPVENVNLDDAVELLDGENINKSVDEDTYWEALVKACYKTGIDDDHYYADLYAAGPVLPADA